MRVHGRYRPTTAHDEQTAEPTQIEAEGVDFYEARDNLRALVPEGCQLLHIIVG